MSQQTDLYDLPLSTSSATAAEAYRSGVWRILAAQAGMTGPFETAIANDPDFALAHAGLARARQYSGDVTGARAAAAEASRLAPQTSAREQSHIGAMAQLITMQPEAYAAIRAHVADHPRDALLAQTCSSIFGLIGFSGQPGREAELLAFNAGLLPHYGDDDWWCLSQYAFALCETGRIDMADRYIDRSLALCPENANGAHIRSHVWYEAGEVDAGRRYLADWLSGYDRSAMLHGHLSWHVALWALEQGDSAQMWDIVDADVSPGAAEGLPINVLTDTASILYRAALAGEEVAPARWQRVSEYAAQFFPKCGNAFIDTHAALAHAMAGATEPLQRIIDTPAGPAADLVPDLARACRAITAGRWTMAETHLTAAMSDHARLGGSRAQRDLLEHALLSCLLKQGRSDEARRLLQLRRPVLKGTRALHNLAV